MALEPYMADEGPFITSMRLIFLTLIPRNWLLLRRRGCFRRRQRACPSMTDHRAARLRRKMHPCQREEFCAGQSLDPLDNQAREVSQRICGITERRQLVHGTIQQFTAASIAFLDAEQCGPGRFLRGLV